MFETAGNFEQNQDLYRNIQEALQDSQLTSEETSEILSRYNEAYEDISNETSQTLSLLNDEILLQKKEVYQELRDIFETSREDIRKIQMLSGVGVDGLIGPQTFSGFLRLSTRLQKLQGASPREVLDQYDEVYESIGDTFSQKDTSLRREIQRESGTAPDGIFGPNTFRAIMRNWDEVKNHFSGEVLEVPNSREEDIVLENIQETEDVEVVLNERGDVEEDLDIGDNSGEVGETQEVSGEQEDGSDRVPERLSDTERREKLTEDARGVPRALIRLLQVSVGGGSSGIFGPKTLEATLQAFPDAQSLTEVFQSLNIQLESDRPLSRDGSPEVFREQYNPFIAELARQFDIPVGLIDSIIGRETDYGANLTHSGGSKGMMQLTNVIFEDMRQPGRRERLFRPLFQQINIDNLSNIELGDGTLAGENIPRPIQDILTVLANPETSNNIFDQNISILQNYLKGDPNYFNHLTNMIVGSLWLKHHHSQSNGDIFTTARNYNGNPALRDAYGRNVVERFNSYEGPSESLPPQEPTLDIEFDTPLEEPSSIEEVPNILNGQELSSAVSWIESRVSEFNLQRLALYFEVEREDNPDFLTELAQIVAQYQFENQLTVDGKPGPQTLGNIDFGEIDIALIPANNREYLERYVPQEWRETVARFISHLNSNEILSPRDPITVADSSRNEAIYLINGEYRTFPVIFGRGGFTDQYVGTGDAKTPRGVVMRFNRVRIAPNEYGDASNGQNSTTVLGASLQSDDTMTTSPNIDGERVQTGKWFHGVSDARMRNMVHNTIGCVGMSVQNARAIARDIQRNGNRGFGFVA